MQYLKSLVLIAALALFPLGALAASENHQSVDIPNTLKVGNTQIAPGNYKVEWQGSGPAVQVKFVEHGKTVVTAPATLKTNDSQVIQSDIITDPTHSNIRALREIDFGHQKEALIFHRSAS
jgi:hypothetical protein